MRTRRFITAGLAALALTAGAACSEEDQEQIGNEVEEQGENLEDRAGEVRENVGQEVDERTDELDDDTSTTGD